MCILFLHDFQVISVADIQIILEIAMALPHMPSIYTTRKNIYEAAIVRRRTQEDDFHDKWADSARYYNSTDIKSSKDADWSSKKTFESR